MPRRFYFLLFLLGLALPLFIARFQPYPGYLDADYYFAGGIQLAEGRGFNEPYVWNYLDGATSLPHPSHGYWMPLASILAAAGMMLTGATTYASARLFFFLVAALVPPLTAKLAHRFSRRKDLALTSGLLAVFCVYNAPFLGVTDNFGIFMLLGALYFLAVSRMLDFPENQAPRRYWFALGVLSGLFSLSRSDGLLWLGVTFLFALRDLRLSNYKTRLPFVLLRLSLALGGFLLVMGGWYLRNWQTYGTLMTPGGSRALWLTHYDETFVYPPANLTFENFLAQGWQKILAARSTALRLNLLNAFAAHGAILLFPFILIGAFRFRRDQKVKLAAFAWLTLLLIMSFAFPFAGARGAFFHAGAAFQPLWWVLAPLGLESFLSLFDEKKFGSEKSRFVFRAMMVWITVMLTAYVVHYRLVVLGWGEGEQYYPAVEQFLLERGIQPEEAVIVGNAPGYYISADRPAVSIPYGGEEAIRAVANQFNARYVIFESKNFVPPKNEAFIYLGKVSDARIYKIEP